MNKSCPSNMVGPMYVHACQTSPHSVLVVVKRRVWEKGNEIRCRSMRKQMVLKAILLIYF